MGGSGRTNFCAWPGVAILGSMAKAQGDDDDDGEKVEGSWNAKAMKAHFQDVRRRSETTTVQGNERTEQQPELS